MIRFGELIFAGSTAELLARTSAHIDIRPERREDLDALLTTVRSGGWHAYPEADTLRVSATADRAGALNRAASAAGITLEHLVVVQDRLEDIFLAMTGTADEDPTRGRAAAAATQTTEEVA